MPMEIKITLKAARVNRELSAKEVAQMLGYKDPRTITNYENGTKRIRVDTLRKLAVIYEIPVEMINV